MFMPVSLSFLFLTIIHVCTCLPMHPPVLDSTCWPGIYKISNPSLCLNDFSWYQTGFIALSERIPVELIPDLSSVVFGEK